MSSGIPKLIMIFMIRPKVLLFSRKDSTVPSGCFCLIDYTESFVTKLQDGHHKTFRRAIFELHAR